MRVCSSIKPYHINDAGIVMQSGQKGLLAPIIVTVSSGQHLLASGRQRCMAGQVMLSPSLVNLVTATTVTTPPPLYPHLYASSSRCCAKNRMSATPS